VKKGVVLVGHNKKRPREGNSFFFGECDGTQGRTQKEKMWEGENVKGLHGM